MRPVYENAAFNYTKDSTVTANSSKDEYGETEDRQRYISSCRKILRQIISLFGINLHSLSIGIALGFPTIVIAQLCNFNHVWTSTGEKFKIYMDSKYETKEVSYDNELASWHGSVALASLLLGSLVSSLVQPRFGRRTILIVANIFLITAWSLSSVAQQPALIIASSALASIYAGSLVAPILVYQSETLSPRFLSSFLLPTNHISLMLGTVIEMALGAFIGWRTVAAINTIFPSICLIMVLILPESPAFHQQYIKNDNFTSTNTIKSTPNSWIHNRNNHRLREEDLEDPKRHKAAQSFVRKPAHLHGIALLSASLCYLHLCGMTVVRTYSTLILGMLSTYGLPPYIHIFPLMLACIQLCGAGLGLVLRGWSGRSCRMPLLLASYIGSIGSCIALGLYSHFFIHSLTITHPNVKIMSAIPAWLPSVLLGMHSFASCMSIPLVPYSFAGEFFPSFALELASRFTLFLSCIICFLGNKLFFSAIKVIGLRGFFCIYSATGAICAALICILLPQNLDNNDEVLTKCPWYYMSKGLDKTWVDGSSNESSEERATGTNEIIREDEKKYNYSDMKHNSPDSEFKVEKRNITREIPEWLGDISWAGCHGGWLIEERGKGGWTVTERGWRHEGGGGRSMHVEKGTCIGHMIRIVTSAVTAEESKDLTKWKLANRAKKQWIITQGPNNQWQICSAPWESDTSDESGDDNESDSTSTADESTNNSESSSSNDIHI